MQQHCGRWWALPRPLLPPPEPQPSPAGGSHAQAGAAELGGENHGAPPLEIEEGLGRGPGSCWGRRRERRPAWRVMHGLHSSAPRWPLRARIRACTQSRVCFGGWLTPPLTGGPTQPLASPAAGIPTAWDADSTLVPRLAPMVAPMSEGREGRGSSAAGRPPARSPDARPARHAGPLDPRAVPCSMLGVKEIHSARTMGPPSGAELVSPAKRLAPHEREPRLPLRELGAGVWCGAAAGR